MVDGIAQFIIPYVTTYLIDTQYANLLCMVGLVFGGFTTLFCPRAIFSLPKLMDRSSEEIAKLFDFKLWAWHSLASRPRTWLLE